MKKVASILTIIIFVIVCMGCNKKSPTGIEQDTVTDIDGNVYQTVKIGDQVWMVENLKVTRYRDGTPIPNVKSNGDWIFLNAGARCAYNNSEKTADTYGYLYNWYAVKDSRNIAPAGWHVPTDADWKELEMYLGMNLSEADNSGWRGTVEGGMLKEAGTSHWQSPNIGATNESGFFALPGGYRNLDGYFDLLGCYASFWSSAEYGSNSPWMRYLDFDNSKVERSNVYIRRGFSVRLIRD